MNTVNTVDQSNILDNIPFGFIRVNLSGEIVYANISAFQLLKLDSTELLGQKYYRLPWEQFNEDYTPLKDEDHTIYQALNEKIEKSVVRMLIIDSDEKWFSISSSPYYQEGQLIGAVSYFVDITEKKTLEEELKTDADRHKVLVENIDAVIWESEKDSSIFSYVSPKVEEIFGYPHNAWFQPNFWQQRVHPEDLGWVTEFEKNQTSDFQLEYRFLCESGDFRWVRDHVKVVKDGDKMLLRGMILDITRNKEAELKLIESKERYKKLINEAPYAITVYDKDGTLITANSKFKKYWNVPPDRDITTFNLFESELFGHQKFTSLIQHMFEGNTGEFTSELPLSVDDDSKGTFRVKYYPLLDVEGKLDNVICFLEDITNYLQVEQKIRDEEALKQGILDALGDGILVVDNEGLVLNINKSLNNYLRRESILQIEVGRSVFDFVDELDKSKFLRNALHSILAKESNFFEHQLKLKDGKWYSLRATQLIDRFGAVISFQNVNTRKEIELALEKSLRKYRNIYNKAPVMMHSIDRELRIISVSDFWLDKMGYDRNEVIGKSPADFLTEASKEEIVDNLRELVKLGEIKNRQYQYVKKSGEVIDVLLSAVAEYDDQGQFERSIAGMIDISEQKAAERELKESGAKLLEAQKISKLGNYELDLKTMEMTPSNEMALMMGIDAEVQHIDKIFELAHPDDLDDLKAHLTQCVSTKDDLFYIYRIFHGKTYKQRWISKRGRIIIGELGEPLKLIGTIQDITEQRTAEDKIKRLSDRILLATEIANLGVWEYDRVTEEIFWEDQMYHIFSDTDEPFKATGFKKYLTKENDSALLECLDLIKKGVNFLENEFQIKVEDEIKYLRSFTRILRNDTGSMRSMIGVIYDITSDKKLQEELEFSLDEKNILIKEVHHRVKNNMQLISSIMALRAYDLEDEKSKEIFDDINTRIKAMALIHDKLYKFYNVSEIDIQEYLTHISQELKVLLGIRTIQMNVESDRLIMNVDQALLVGLIVSELVSNAVKHSYSKNKEGIISIMFNSERGKNTLAVINDGKRVPSDSIDTGTGLGMSLIKTFAKQLKGTFNLDPRNGFKIDF